MQFNESFILIVNFKDKKNNLNSIKIVSFG
jgi:hypothetical protein